VFDAAEWKMPCDTGFAYIDNYVRNQNWNGEQLDDRPGS
jgi:hypothetical protein